MSEGDSTASIEELLAKAEAGDPEAQYEVGCRYGLGRDVEEDDPEAVRWLRRAADQGHALAQNNLGARYLSGTGTEADPVEAYRWFHLAAEQGDRKAEKNRDSVAGQLTAEQLAEARRRAGQTE